MVTGRRGRELRADVDVRSGERGQPGRARGAAAQSREGQRQQQEQGQSLRHDVTSLFCDIE